MCELVTLRGLCMWDLVQKSRRDWTIQHQVALEQLDFLDCLPSLDRCRTRGVLNGLVVERVLGIHLIIEIVWIWAIRVGASQHWPAILLVLPVVVRLCTVALVRALVVRCGVVRLIVVCVVMRLRVERVVAVVSLRSWVVIVVIVSSCVWNVLYRVLSLLESIRLQIVLL
jgi:hypothetical protein